jgi:hypothetical protein
MFILDSIIAIVVIVAFVLSIKRFNRHCMAQYNHAFFTKPAFYLTTISVFFLEVGFIWRQSSAQSHGDTLNGTLLVVIGIALAGWVVYKNVKNTDLLYGVGGSTAQIVLFGFLAYAGLPIMIFGLLCYFTVLATAKPVYVVNR